MKVITWKEMFEIKGDVVWGYYDPHEFPENIYIKYNGDLKGDIKRVCSEGFPITVPDYGFDYFSAVDKFNDTEEGVVSNLDTFGDIYEEGDKDIKVIIYDQNDINRWINKLKGLSINY